MSQQDNFSEHRQELPATAPEQAESTAGDEATAARGREKRRGKYQAKRTKKKKLPLAVRIILIIFVVLLVLLIAAAVTFYVMYSKGKANMLSYDNVVVSFPDSSDQVITYDDGKTISYKGHSYQLNENMTTVLFMGVDKKDLEESEVYGVGGQADCVLLIAMDTKTGKTTIINISREAYAEVDKYSADGGYIGTVKEQLCLAYAYGNGRETSCENMIRSVERLIYGIPIQSYIALDMAGVSAANDMVGGVTVTSLSEINLTGGRVLHVGEEITLHGSDAERYIRAREMKDLDANNERMERQKQYVQAFASIVTQNAKQDLTFPVTLFNGLSEYMVSNLTASDVTFLATCYLDHGASFAFNSVPGTIDKLGGSAVYYLDEDNLKDTIISVFYTMVD